MDDLWADRREEAWRKVEPLAVRMRPRTFDEFAGQAHIVGEGRLLRRMIEADALTSVILHGPPGTGKTTLAEVIAAQTGRVFERENAATVGVKRIRAVIDDAAHRLASGGKRTILFLDEIHRFTRSQQDVLLGDVERGLITLIGATTENPLFTVNSALVSRSTLFKLEPLEEADVVALLRRAIADKDRGCGELDVRATDEALAHWAKVCDGDARRALNALEVAVLSGGTKRADLRTQGANGDTAKPVIEIDLEVAEESAQGKAVTYAPLGDEHYDAISAMIKSIRGSDPDAALYWIARMLEGGEDPRYIARRLAILASEDIGNADPRSVMVADATWSLVERIGMPEARITLGQCATYLALAPKSNAAYLAIDAAIADVREGRTLPVPMFLRDGNKVKSTGSEVEGRGYEYTHGKGRNSRIGHVSGQDYLGVDRRYYEPIDSGLETKLRERLEEVRKLRGKG